MEEKEKELDFEFKSYEEEGEYAGSVSMEGVVWFKFKGKEYDVGVDVHTSWDDRNDLNDKYVEIVDDKPSDISDEDWADIKIAIEQELQGGFRR